MDLNTLKISSLCLDGKEIEPGWSFRAVWSPDSRFFTLNSGHDYDILVDTQEWHAYKISTSMYIKDLVSWLASP